MTDARTPRKTTQPPGQLVGLLALSSFALLIAVVLGVVGAMTASSYMTDDDIELVAALAWWSNLAITIGIVAGVGTLVLAGVRRMLISAGLDV